MAIQQVEHVVIIVKENHTFDNYFGSFTGADGELLARAQNPPPDDPNHRHEAWMTRAQDLAHKVQYLEQDIPAYFALARQYTLCDRYFSEVAGPSTPNHLMLIAADAPIIANPRHHYRPTASQRYDLRSLPELLEAKGLTWGNYGGYPFQYIDSLADSQSNHSSEMFVKHARAGQLPTVSWLYGESHSEHPKQNVTDGSQWTREQIQALVDGGLWHSSVVFVTWDDWGGWHDHVEPPVVETWTPQHATHAEESHPEFAGQPFRYGSRVPCLVVSPFAKSKHVSSTQRSHVSLVRFCELAFELPSLNQRDGNADGMLDCFDFRQSPLPPPSAAGPALHFMNVVVRPGSLSERVHFAAVEGLPAPDARAGDLPPTPDHDLRYRGGRAFPHLAYLNIFVGGAAQWDPADRERINDGLDAAMNHPGLNNVLAQYLRDPIATEFLGSRFLLNQAPQVITRGDVDALVLSTTENGSLDGLDLSRTVINFFLPRGTILTDNAVAANQIFQDGYQAYEEAQPESPGRQGREESEGFVAETESNSLAGLGGYHGSVQLRSAAGAPQTVYFAVGVFSEQLADGSRNGIPAFGDPWKSVVATFYHELCEARTDPDVEDANRQDNSGLLGWVSAPPGQRGEEIGDFPIFEAGRRLDRVFQEIPPANGGGNTVPVQFQYSNFVHGPEGPIDAPHPFSETGQGAGRQHVFLKRGRQAVHHPSAAHAAHPRSTPQFRISVVPGLGTRGATIADAILATCEQDFQTLRGFFGDITPGRLPFHVIVTAGADGASHAGCEATELSIGANSSDGGLNLLLMRQLVIAEADEVFEANFGAGWNCGQSHGEGLSRVLANDIVPGGQTPGFVSAPDWLNGGRPNWVDRTEDSDVQFVSIGCAVLFLNWMRFQLGHPWREIIAAGKETATLGETFAHLTRANNGWTTFKGLMDRHFPPGTPVSLDTDNPFPLPVA